MSSYGARHRVNYISDSILKVLEVGLILHSFQLKTLRLRELGCLVHGPGSANGWQTLGLAHIAALEGSHRSPGILAKTLSPRQSLS